MANRSTSISELWVSSELVVVSSPCKHENSGLKIPPQLPACSCGGCRSDELTDRQMDRSESLIHLSFWGQEFHQSLEGDAQDEIWKKIGFFSPLDGVQSAVLLTLTWLDVFHQTKCSCFVHLFPCSCVDSSVLKNWMNSWCFWFKRIRGMLACFSSCPTQVF